jgi:N utilization substance protein B
LTDLGGQTGSREKVERIAAMRAGARLAATQAIYQWQATGAQPAAIVSEFAEHRIGQSVDGMELPAANLALFGEIVLGVTANATDIDNMISGALASDWSLERLESTLRAILRCGTYELAHRRDIPAKATITQYVAVSDAFFGAKETGLVNGVLDHLARALRPDEMEIGVASRSTPR